MSGKRKDKRTAASGLVRLLTACTILLLLSGAFFYITQFDKIYASVVLPGKAQTQEEAFSAVESGRTALDEKNEGLLLPESYQENNEPFDHEPVALPQGLEIPLCAAMRGKVDHEIRKFSDYSICYRESYEEAEWSAYCLKREDLVKNARRTNDFRPDPEISTASADSADYTHSGYDRGHLAPAADFAYSEISMSETFYMSNITPQQPEFNRGIWKKLEAQVRVWAEKYGRAYVVSGPLLSSPPEDYEKIGANEVVVPRAFYKVVLVPLYADEEDEASPEDADDLAAFAFIIPNQKCQAPFYDYAVTVSEVEERTGLDFFYLLDDKVEARIESALE